MSEEAESAQPDEPPMTEEERLAKREKQVLYLRHRLQKGFLSRDQAPKDEDMAAMSGYLKDLEAHDDLEAEVIKKTKVHKVLKAIIKLNSIPKEEEYAFKQRSSELLTKWGGALAADPETAAGAPAEAATNGVKHDESEKPESPKEESPVEKNGDATAEKKDEEEKKEDTTTEIASATKAVDLNGDVTMADADKQLNKDEPAVNADAESSVKASVETAAGVDTASAPVEATTS
jgi:hypothetical protein